MKKVNTHKMIICALFAAMCYVATNLLKIPALFTKGYVNAGDVVVLVSAYIIAARYSAAASGIGSALADVSLGYYMYSPATLIIKALVALTASAFYKKAACTSGKIRFYTLVIIGTVIAEAVMIGGYFVFEWALYGELAVALTSVVGNLIQGVTCAVIAVVLIAIFKNSKAMSKMIENLK